MHAVDVICILFHVSSKDMRAYQQVGDMQWKFPLQFLMCFKMSQICLRTECFIVWSAVMAMLPVLFPLLCLDVIKHLHFNFLVD
jgi:hypothetical protein